MTVELLKTLSLVSFILAGVLFLVAVALFFLLGVPRLVGDITGSTARKAIENIRQQNEQSGDKAYKPSPVNAARGKITDKISPSGRLQHRTGDFGGSPGTQKISTAKLMPQVSETAVLHEEAYRTANETMVLQEGTYGTASETTVLNEAEYGAEAFHENGHSFADVQIQQPAGNGFRVEMELGFLASAELIE